MPFTAAPSALTPSNRLYPAKQRTEILSDGKSLFWGTRFSPDERWIAWAANDKESGVSQIFIAPFHHALAIPKHEWTPVVTGKFWSGNPAWSPAGNWIYYLSDKDGMRCIYAQRFDQVAQRPEGQPIAVYHSHGTQRLDWISQSWQNLSVGLNRIAFLQPESRYSVWMTDLDVLR